MILHSRDVSPQSLMQSVNKSVRAEDRRSQGVNFLQSSEQGAQIATVCANPQYRVSVMIILTCLTQKHRALYIQ